MSWLTKVLFIPITCYGKKVLLCRLFEAKVLYLLYLAHLPTFFFFFWKEGIQGICCLNTVFYSAKNFIILLCCSESHFLDQVYGIRLFLPSQGTLTVNEAVFLMHFRAKKLLSHLAIICHWIIIISPYKSLNLLK